MREWIFRLQDKEPKKGKQPPPLANEEAHFIRNELLLTKADFRYWASRYATINTEGAGLGTLYPLLDSQEFVLGRIGALELEHEENPRGQQGIFINTLKAARQVGMSTLAEAIGAHRFTTQDNLFGLIASDVPGEDGSGYLFGMFERFVENLPWWLRPRITDHVKNEEMAFDGGSHIWVGAGKSMKGKEGARGQLGRGKTLSFVHLSELSTWDNPDQIDDSLMPALPKAARTFVLFESTAKGRRANWWKQHWDLSKEGKTDPRFAPVYIPWYVEMKYSEEAPEGWVAAPTTLAYARRVEEVGHLWAGRPVRLLKSQIYWYEAKRASYVAKGKLREFLEEFGSIDDDECFQNTGRSVISVELQQAVKDKSREMIALLDVKPTREILR